MRAVLGAVNWLVTGTRPDLAASCSLLQQRVTQSVVEDLVDTNRLVACVHEHADMKDPRSDLTRGVGSPIL